MIHMSFIRLSVLLLFRNSWPLHLLLFLFFLLFCLSLSLLRFLFDFWNLLLLFTFRNFFLNFHLLLLLFIFILWIRILRWRNWYRLLWLRLNLFFVAFLTFTTRTFRIRLLIRIFFSYKSDRFLRNILFLWRLNFPLWVRIWSSWNWFRCRLSDDLILSQKRLPFFGNFLFLSAKSDQV